MSESKTFSSHVPVPLESSGLFRFAQLTLTPVCAPVGVAVPSILSYIYYLVFLLVLIIWSLHLKLKWAVRVVRVAIMIYAILHLVLLDLYQFQSGQDLVEALPLDTTHSLLARYSCVILCTMSLYICTSCSVCTCGL